MTTKEVALLQRYLLKADSYLEYGSGRSTALASSISSIRHIVSVESDVKFVEEHVAIHPEVKQAIADDRLRFDFVNIGPTGLWGHPTDKSKRHMWPSYPLGCLQERRWNLVLVDGRFRVACCLAAALELPPESIILLHDFYRPEYHFVLKFMEQVTREDNLVQLRLRANANRAAVQSAIGNYQYIPGDCTKSRVIFRKIKQKLGMKDYQNAPTRESQQG
ncbi:hypothetical protein ESB00_14490 [Oleiharenicola lentus]|uniref:Class I SAM-dependent methyltransferase n=1 Tax=Oleiharenicola lentus TaxID=2508720 RepID=A0A4Q1C3I9_9BACT|nr:hypothetical protein [Oleiharenicola lentus]RXK52917.1 hypothetical protein ESB00_14490 [Oleiharenicola lentus]